MGILHAVLVAPFVDIASNPRFLAEVLIGGVASGLMYSEHALSRGNAARSTTRTENPARASRMAVALPAGPAPVRSFDPACSSRSNR